MHSCRRSHQRCSIEKGFLKNAQHADLLKIRLWHRGFPVNFDKFLRTPFFTEHLRTTVSVMSIHKTYCFENNNQLIQLTVTVTKLLTILTRMPRKNTSNLLTHIAWIPNIFTGMAQAFFTKPVGNQNINNSNDHDFLISLDTSQLQNLFALKNSEFRDKLFF